MYNTHTHTHTRACVYIYFYIVCVYIFLYIYKLIGGGTIQSFQSAHAQYIIFSHNFLMR